MSAVAHSLLLAVNWLSVESLAAAVEWSAFTWLCMWLDFLLVKVPAGVS